MQLFAFNFILLQDHRTCVGCRSHPSSGVHKTVITASGAGHINCAATVLQHGQVLWYLVSYFFFLLFRRGGSLVLVVLKISLTPVSIVIILLI